MKLIKLLASAALVALLAACGGGGGSAGTTGSSTTTTTTTATITATVVTNVELLGNTNQLSSATGSEVLLSALVIGAGNNALADQTVAYSSTGGVLYGGVLTTNSNGVSTIKLGPGSDKTNRIITVTATSGAKSATFSIPVIGTVLTISGPTTVAFGENKTYTVKAVDSSGNAIRGVVATVASSLGNSLSSSTVTTNDAGLASFSMTASIAGNDVLSVSGSGAAAQSTVLISATDFAILAPTSNLEISVAASQTVTARFRLSGVGVSGRTVIFSSTSGAVSPTSVVTNGAGEATTFVSSASASPAVLQANLTGANVALASVPIEFVATTVSALVLQVSPSSLAPNAIGSTTNQAEVQATVRDPSGNPVKNKVVNFNLIANPSGGSLSQAAATTNSNGKAGVQYISGSNSSSALGVILSGNVVGTAVSGTTALTVNNKALFITIGTNNEIGKLDELNYKKDFTVYVTDSSGAAVRNVVLTMSTQHDGYLKGSLAWNGSAWIAAPTTPGVTTTLSAGQSIYCANEDLNLNGTKDVGEDINGDGILWPGAPITVDPVLVTTDGNGRATVSLIYAESFAPWVAVTLRATAIVEGTESTAKSSIIVVGSTTDFTDDKNPPAGVISPYKTGGSCTNPL